MIMQLRKVPKILWFRLRGCGMRNPRAT